MAKKSASRIRKTRPATRYATSRSSKKRHAKRILGLHWHHFSILTLLVIAGVTLFAFTASETPGQSAAASSDPPAIGSSAAPANYQEAWGDEFNGSSVDSSKWNELNNSNYGASNHEDECYYANNITESGGHLNVAAKQQTVTCGGANPDLTTANSSYKDTYFYTSGFLTSRANGSSAQKYSFQYGYVEAAIEMPKGNPYWGAFWLVGDNSAPAWPDYGEFDIMEQHGIYPDTATGTIHYPGNCSGNNCNNNSSNLYNILTNTNTNTSANNGTELTSSNFSTYSGVASTTYVRYGFLWEPTRITWYINGIPLRSLDSDGTLTSYTATTAGVITGSTTKSLTAADPNYPLSKIFSYYHTIDLNLSVGGSAPQYSGYTGGEVVNGDGTVSYNPGNITPDNGNGTMKVDYVRVYQYVAPPAPDTTAPSVSLSSPATGSTQKGTITVGGSASDNVGVSKVELFVDSQLVATDTSAPYSFTLDTSKYSDGSHALYLEAFDAAGNHTDSNTATITVKNTPDSTGSGGSGSGSGGSGSSGSGSGGITSNPVISINSPSSSTPIPVNGTITVEPADGSSVSVEVDGKSAGNTINTKKLTNGTHTITINENGVTKKQVITVHNSWPTAVANELQAHKAAYSASGISLIVVIGALVWFFRRRVSLWLLRHLRMKYLDYPGLSKAIKFGLKK